MDAQLGGLSHKAAKQEAQRSLQKKTKLQVALGATEHANEIVLSHGGE
jgi:hypothetical protein